VNVVISGKNLTKSFGSYTVINNFSFSIDGSSPCAILGKNGAGKSTVLKIMAGILKQDAGSLIMKNNTGIIPHDKRFAFLSIVAPYMELIEDFSLEEKLHFHANFSKPINQFSTNTIISNMNFDKNKHVKIKDFSSGMKQKLKIALAIFFDKPLLLFDEPCANLDSNAIDWYIETVKKHAANRTLTVFSNQNEHEYPFCKQQLML